MAQDNISGQDSGMNKDELIEEYRLEVQRCWAIAQHLDAFNPTLPGAFTGNPSDRIERQLESLKAPGFCDE